jgi:hypothetical protein
MPLVRASRKLINALVVELVDTLDLGSSAERCEGSSPSQSTNECLFRLSLKKGERVDRMVHSFFVPKNPNPQKPTYIKKQKKNLKKLFLINN